MVHLSKRPIQVIYEYLEPILPTLLVTLQILVEQTKKTNQK